jgi:glycosyltransferase involved in cell wall biosynthesis
VVPSERSRTLYRRSGVEEARLKVVHPGVPDVAKLEPGVPREGWLVVGRLTSEKGILGLARMWPDRERLDVVGDGGEMPELAAVADTKHTISLHGSLDPADVAGLMGRAKGLIVPSVCFEGFPTVVAEALRAGTPVIALEGNSAADFVMQESAERTVGAVYDSVEELRRAMDVVASQDLDDACRRVYVRELSAERFVDRLVRLYGDVIASREVDG